jgi:hypothetical protein
MPRLPHEPGKGGLWYIVEDRKEAFKKEGLKTTSRGGARQSSNPNSPAPRKSPKKKTPPNEDFERTMAIPTSTPPMPQTIINGTQTPSRLPRFENSHQLPQLAEDSTPLPRNQPYLSQTVPTAGSPNPSSQVYLAEPVTGYSFQTPVPQRTEPRFTMPSTAKLPSQWLPQSSPNLWHIDINSKPFPFDSSPIKRDGDAPTAGLRSSSPPPAIADGSPTRPRLNTIETRINGTNSKESESKIIPSPKEDEEDMQIDLMAYDIFFFILSSFELFFTNGIIGVHFQQSEPVVQTDESLTS